MKRKQCFSVWPISTELSRLLLLNDNDSRSEAQPQPSLALLSSVLSASFKPDNFITTFSRLSYELKLCILWWFQLELFFLIPTFFKPQLPFFLFSVPYLWGLALNHFCCSFDKFPCCGKFLSLVWDLGQERHGVMSLLNIKRLQSQHAQVYYEARHSSVTPAK